MRPVVAQGHNCVTVNATGCGFDPHSSKLNMYLNVYIHFFALVSRQIAALSSATQHAISPESGGKLGTEWLGTLGVPNAYLAECGIQRETD